MAAKEARRWPGPAVILEADRSLRRRFGAHRSATNFDEVALCGAAAPKWGNQIGLELFTVRDLMMIQRAIKYFGEV